MRPTLLLMLAITGFGETRTQELEQIRLRHVQQMGPERATGSEELFRRLKDDRILERINYGYNGLSAKIGGMVTGGGFAFGPQYFRNDLKDGAVVVRAAAQISLKKYQRADALLLFPKLFGGKAFVEGRTTYRNYPGLQYYGPGPDSARNRTNYRLEDTTVDGTVGFAPSRFVKAGGGVGFLAVNTGRGSDSRFSSADAIFTEAQVPGIERQTNFLRYGAFGQIDRRDNPFGPRNGGSYSLQYTRFQDRDLKRHDFGLMEADLQQYVGLFNRTRVLAFRAHARLTDTSSGQAVPFYLQPVVGGSDDLRGFRPFRFSGSHSVVFNSEYRWAIFSGCDGAVFADAGKVFSRRGQLNFNDLEGSAGFGLRFNARNRPFMRVDVGFSHEGFQVWFKFNDVFQQRPLGPAETQPIS